MPDHEKIFYQKLQELLHDYEVEIKSENSQLIVRVLNEKPRTFDVLNEVTSCRPLT